MTTMQLFGDSYASGFAGAGFGVENFGALLAADLGHDFTNHAIPGTGYVNAAGGNTFLAQANAQAAAGVSTSLVFGSLNDQTLSAATVQANATSTYNKIKTMSPGVQLIVVGPAWPTSARPSDLVGIRNAVRTAALAAGAIFIDALDGLWFDARPELIGQDGWHPTRAGHAHMWRKIRAAPGVLP